MGWWLPKFPSTLKAQMRRARPRHAWGAARDDGLCKARPPQQVIRALLLPLGIPFLASQCWPPPPSLWLCFLFSYTFLLPIHSLFSPFLLLLSACAYVFSAPNFCHISFLNFCCISIPMLMSSVYFTLCNHFAFHFQGLFPFDLCLSVCIYTHTDTYRYIYIHKSWSLSLLRFKTSLSLESVCYSGLIHFIELFSLLLSVSKYNPVKIQQWFLTTWPFSAFLHLFN